MASPKTTAAALVLGFSADARKFTPSVKPSNGVYYYGQRNNSRKDLIYLFGDPMNKIIGFDPGANGGICIMTESPIPDSVFSSISTIPMPTTKWTSNRKMVDDIRISNLLREQMPIGHAFIELVHAMPKNGATSMFSFGAGWGMLRGICAGLGIPYTLVTPQAWQKVMLFGLPKGSEETVASSLWPVHTWIAPGCRTSHSGMIDSALITEYGRRTLYQST